MLALRAVQRHTAASRSTRPSRRVQQGFFGGLPRETLIRPSRTLAHTPSLSVSMGHFPEEGEGVGVGLEGGGGHGTPVEETKVKNRRLRERRKDVEAKDLEAIFQEKLDRSSKKEEGSQGLCLLER